MLPFYVRKTNLFDISERLKHIFVYRPPMIHLFSWTLLHSSTIVSYYQNVT